MSWKRLNRLLSYAYTAFLFTKSDFKTTVFPIVKLSPRLLKGSPY